MRLFFLHFCWRTCFLSSKFTSESVLYQIFGITPIWSFSLKFLFSLEKVILKSLFSKVLKPHLLQNIVYTRWVTWGKMCILASFSWFEVRAHLKYCIFLKSFAFVYGSVQECHFCFRCFSLKSYCGMVFISLLNEFSYFLSTDIPYWKNIISESFPNKWVCVTFAKDICFYFCLEDVGKSHRHFSSSERSVKLFPLSVPGSRSMDSSLWMACRVLRKS